MIEKISNYIVDNVLLTNESPDEDYREVMCFGVTRILEDIPKFASIFFMCYLLGVINQFFVVLAITLTYKAFVGGAHARTNIGCFLISIRYYIPEPDTYRQVNGCNRSYGTCRSRCKICRQAADYQ
jgi:accessory gene regulator protein AgrB